MAIGEEIGAKVAALRDERGLVQTDIGNLLAISGSAVSNREKGKADFTPEELRKLAEFFGVTVGWLFGEDAQEGAGPDELRLLRLYKDASAQGQLDILKTAIDCYLEERGRMK
jgi:transcriptional regulator with XRE-family HTH domain